MAVFGDGRHLNLTMVIRPSLPQDAEAIALLSSQLGYPVPASQVAALQVSLLATFNVLEGLRGLVYFACVNAPRDGR